MVNLLSSAAVPCLVDNQAFATKTSFPLNDPHDTQKKLYDVQSITIDDVANVVASSQKALEGWKAMSAVDRRSLFLNASRLLKERVPEIASIEAAETT
jgi:acyl-CoA reductase-like NAD-dependent aldehyde dehydrogenase